MNNETSNEEHVNDLTKEEVMLNGSVTENNFSYVMKTKFYDIKPCVEEKRVRVFSSQLLDTIVHNITLKNYLWKVCAFLRDGDKLISKYPSSEGIIRNSYVTFWSKVQQKLKSLKPRNKKDD